MGGGAEARKGRLPPASILPSASLTIGASEDLKCTRGLLSSVTPSTELPKRLDCLWGHATWRWVEGSRPPPTPLYFSWDCMEAARMGCFRALQRGSSAEKSIRALYRKPGRSARGLMSCRTLKDVAWKGYLDLSAPARSRDRRLDSFVASSFPPPSFLLPLVSPRRFAHSYKAPSPTSPHLLA